jgi:uncharacterized protein
MKTELFLTVIVFLLFSAGTQSHRVTVAYADSGQSKKAVQKTVSTHAASPATDSDQQVLKKKYRTVYQTVNGQQMILVEVLSPLMNLPLTQIRNKAARHEPAAIYELARRYMRGEGVLQNPEKAIPLLNQAAAAGSADAQNDLAGLYDFGRLWFAQDHRKAFELYRKAAKQGHPLAQYNLGACYYEGAGTPIDYKKSLFWTRKSADQGYLKATVMLGWHYADGHGVAKDTDKALKLFHQAANQEEGSAFYAIGKLYDDGDGVPKDYRKAVEWYRKGEKVNDPECLALLGVKYDRGEGVPKSLPKAIAYYRKAAQLGIDMAQYNLGICYYDGDGVERNYRISADWIKKAANQNYPEALGQLSTIYISGQGVNQDLAKAYQYANRAAHLGSDLGFFNVAQFYEHGDNVKQSDIQAYANYRIAKILQKKNGNVNQMTLDHLSRIKAHMSAAQIRTAERKIPKLMHEYGLK